jgi:hypothetical protein
MSEKEPFFGKKFTSEGVPLNLRKFTYSHRNPLPEYITRDIGLLSNSTYYRHQSMVKISNDLRSADLKHIVALGTVEHSDRTIAGHKHKTQERVVGILRADNHPMIKNDPYYTIQELTSDMTVDEEMVKKFLLDALKRDLRDKLASILRGGNSLPTMTLRSMKMQKRWNRKKAMRVLVPPSDKLDYKFYLDNGFREPKFRDHPDALVWWPE